MASATTPSANVTFRYNGSDLRASKISTSGATYYVYGEAGQLLGEYDSNGSPIYETVYLNATPVGVLKQGAIYNVYADHVKAPRIVTKQDHTIVWRWDTAEAFGATAPNQDPSGLGAFVFNQRFPGQVFDAETGLNQNWNREYDVRLGRYKQVDPLGLQGGVNTFGYVSGSPLAKVDPAGLQWIIVHQDIRPPIVDPDLPPGVGPNTVAPPSWTFSWQDDLDFSDNGPKTDLQFWRCKTDEDRDCRNRLIELKFTYTKIKIADLLGLNTFPLKEAYNAVARRYMRECPHWEKVPLFWLFGK